jgi:hypothetical protein
VGGRALRGFGGYEEVVDHRIEAGTLFMYMNKEKGSNTAFVRG